MECAAGCGSRSESDPLDGNLALIPPVQWITVGVDIALQEPPFQQRDERYSGVCCSMDCVITFLRRKKQSMELSKLPVIVERSWDWTPETRSDIAKRIGFLVLEAVTDMDDTGKIVVLPLSEDVELLGREVCVALFPGIPELEPTSNPLD